MGQKRVWAHYVDMTFFISITMFSLHDLYDGGMGKQQNILLLWMFLGEQEKSCSHTLHDVAGGGDGILSLSLDDLEVLPLCKELLVCSKIMENFFDNENVKERSYVLAGAYLHWPTTFSLWSMNLWMECP